MLFPGSCGGLSEGSQMLGELGGMFYTAQGMQSGLESAPLKQVES